MRLSTILRRSLRLRCPVCGGGRLFDGWFRMHPRCDQCEFSYDRGPGFYLGSIYVNYGLTALIVTAAYIGLFFADVLGPTELLVLLTAFCVVFPLWFFRYARSIWLGFDAYFDRDDSPGSNVR